MEILHQLKSELDSYYKELLSALKNTNTDAYNELLDHKYSVFYTNPYTTLDKGDIYYLGLNPAGTRKNPQDFIIDKTDFSSYLCYHEDWGKKGKIHQERNRQLLSFILRETTGDGSNEQIKKVFSTNMYFLSSASADSLFNYGIRKDFFFNWHRRFLDIVKPKFIVCNGNENTYKSAYGSMKSLLSKHSEIKEEIIRKDKPYYKGFALKNFEANYSGYKIKVIGVPHMSYHQLDNNTIGDTLFNDLKNIISN